MMAVLVVHDIAIDGLRVDPEISDHHRLKEQTHEVEIAHQSAGFALQCRDSQRRIYEVTLG
jgi:hypothetical protein